MRATSLEKHLLQQVRRSKFQIEMTDFISRRTLKQCGGLFFCMRFRKVVEYSEDA